MKEGFIIKANWLVYRRAILKYLPYVLLFAVATMIVYGWGLWRTMRQGSDLANMLSSKGIS